MAIENRDGLSELLHRAIDDPDRATAHRARLVAATEHEDRSVRINAAWAVCAVAAARPEFAPELRERLDQRSGPTPELAAEWIHRTVAEPAPGDERGSSDDTTSRRSVDQEPGEGSPDDTTNRRSVDEEPGEGSTTGAPDQRGGRPATNSATPTGDGRPASDQPASDQPASDQSASDQSASDQPASDQPASDQPASDQPASDQPASDRPASDRPASQEAGDTVDDSADARDDGSSGGGLVDGPSPPGSDAVVRNGRFTIELDRTAFDSLEVVDRVATDRHSWTYVGMASVDAERRAVLIRTYRPPQGARLSTFSSVFDDVLSSWDGIDDHEGVLTTYDYGRRPHPWVVTEYASETLRSAGRLPVTTALRVGLDAATALAHAHERGVTHRSLDPRSVALDRRDDRPVARVLNFGIVDAFQAVDGPLPLDSRYAGPELFDDGFGGVDWLTDVYHLGTVLYTAFTGRPPYEDSLVGRGGPDGIRYVPPSNVAEGVPVAADRIVAKAMATHKIARYESADELARDLQSALDDRDAGQ